MVVEVADLDGLLAFWAEGYHFAGCVEMLVPEVVVLESFVVCFAVIAVVFRICWLLWLFISVVDHFLGRRISFHLHLLDNPTISLNSFLN